MNKVYYIDVTQADKMGTGIAYKIYKQINIMEENGFDVNEICLKRKMGVIDRYTSKLPFINKRINLKDINIIEDNSIIYIRYFLTDIWLYRKLRSLKQNNENLIILVEFPTYPYDSEYKKFHPYILKDKIWRNRLKSIVDYAITFSDDKSIYGIPSINISNGVDIKKIKCRSYKAHTGINLVAVAKFAPWHGFDRVIEGLAKYYSENKYPTEIAIYIVGYGDDKIKNEYRELINKYGLEGHIFLTGEKSGSELDDIYDQCDIAIDSLGRHRSQVTYNSSLKGKEYMAKGFPIISGVKTELDNYNDYKYYMRVPADDSPVDFFRVVEFFDMIYSNNQVDNVIRYIREFCEKKYDINKAFDPVIQVMKNHYIREEHRNGNEWKK